MLQQTAEGDRAQAGNWHLTGSIAEARAKLHNEPFVISHDLHKSELFEVDRLIEVAKDAANRPGDVYYDAGDVALGDRWGHIPVPDMPVEQVIERIEHCGAWVILKQVEKIPAYAAVLNEFADFVREMAGPDLSRNLRKPEFLVIVSSPNRLTPFHFDAEINFLVQVRGHKEVWICDPQDRTVVSQQNIEDYYSGGKAAWQWNPEFEKRARHFELKSGSAVHIPTHAAHWVRNGNAVSVSLSLNFEFPGWHNRDVYLVNGVLKKFGLKPRPPGKVHVIDVAKSVSWQAAKRVGHALGVKRQ